VKPAETAFTKFWLGKKYVSMGIGYKKNGKRFFSMESMPKFYKQEKSLPQ
jgi:hypothetical protein